MTFLTERADEIGDSPQDAEIEEMIRKVQAWGVIVEATVWDEYTRIFRMGSPIVGEIEIALGPRALFVRLPGPGDTVVREVESGGNEYFVYEYKVPESGGREPAAFSLVFPTSKVSAAWDAEVELPK